MGGPWEDYQPQAASSDVGPWQDYTPTQQIMASTNWGSLKDKARTVGRFAAPAVFPTIGAVLGSPFGPIGSGVGGLGGVAVNQILGITEPSLSEPALQVAVPGLAAGRRALAPFATEAKGAATLNRLAPQEVRSILERYRPPQSAKELFGKLEGEQARVMTPSSRDVAEQELKNIQESLPGFRESYGGLAKQLKGVKGEMERLPKSGLGTDPSLPIGQFQRLLHDVGTHIESASRAGGVEKHGYGSLYRALMQDLEKATLPGEAGQTLATARQAYKREQVLKEIEAIARPFTKRGAGEAEQFNANKVINRLKDAEDRVGKQFQGAFTPEEQTTILDRLTTLNKIPAIPPAKGQSFGSGQFWTHQVPFLAAGGGAGYAYGHSPEATALGLVAGATIPVATRMLNDFSTAWKTDTGKALIKNLLENSGGKISPQFWQTVHAFVASLPSQPGPRLNDILIEKRSATP